MTAPIKSIFIAGMSWIRRVRFPLRAILFVAVSAALIAALPFVPWGDVGQALARSNPMWLVIAMFSNFLAFPQWASQWRLLALPAHSVSWLTMFKIAAMSAVTSLTFSSAAGTTSALLLLINRAKLPAISAASFMAMDQLLVGIAKIVLLTLALSLTPLPPNAMKAIYAFIIVVALFLVLLVGLAFFRHSIWKLVRDPEGLFGRAMTLLIAFSDNLDALRNPTRAFWTIVLAVGKKFANIGAAFAVQLACGIEPSLTSAILTIAALSLTTLVPVIPGNFGIYTATVFVVYETLGVPTGVALAAGLLQHAADIATTLLVGYGAFFADRQSRAAEPGTNNG